MSKCERCHKQIADIQMLTPAGSPICPYCETSDDATSWVCEECGSIAIDNGGDLRPKCEDCGEVMTAYVVEHSRVRGIGTGLEDLELGLVLLMEAQS